MFIVQYKTIFLTIAALIVAAAVGAIAIVGLNYGIEFTGGTLAEVSYTQSTDRTVIENAIAPLALGAYSLRASEDTDYFLRTRPLTQDERGALVTVLEGTGASIERFNEVGPTIGQELQRKAVVAIVLVAVVIALYVAFAFSGVSKPVSSWVYGVIAIVVLVHDVLVPVGVFAYLGSLGAEVDVLFVTALLVVLGYSVNDTIVIFDRIRERLRINAQMSNREDFETTVGTALKQSYTRSINTSLTTLLVLGALYYFGGSTTQYFALTLIAGVVAGTYSSLFIASPLLVAIHNWRNK